MSDGVEALRREYNHLAERYGWKIIPKGRALIPKKLAQQLNDLKDCIEAGVVRPVVTDEKLEWDGVPRRAPLPKEE